MISPLHVRTVREVVRTGSFADAARSLGYTASAVSQQIAALERACGLLPFERRARGIRPTSAAFLLVSKGNDVLSALDTWSGSCAPWPAASAARCSSAASRPPAPASCRGCWRS